MNDTELLKDIRARLSDHRYEHSLQVAKSAAELAERYGGDKELLYTAGLAHDVLKELPKDEALAAATNAEVVQVIGGVMVLYRYNPKLHEEKKKIPVKKAPEKKRYERVQLKKKSPFEDKKGRDKRIVKKVK